MWASVSMRVLITLIVVVVVMLAGWGDGLDRGEFDTMTVLTAPPPPDAGIVVIGLDDASILELGLSPPLPRSVHARLITALAQAGVAAVGFDMLFSEPQSRGEDDALAQALAAAADQGMAVILARAVVSIDSSQVDAYVQELTPVFAHARSGRVNLHADPDGVVRLAPSDDEAFWRQLANAAGRHFVTPTARARLRYYAPEIPLPYAHYTQALDPARHLAPGALAGRIVMIGQNTPIGGVDLFPTPLSALTGSKLSGLLLQATATLNGLHGDWIETVPWWVSTASMTAALLLVAATTRKWRPGRALLVTLAVGATLAGTGTLLFRAGTWLVTWPGLVALAVFYNASAAHNYWEQWRRREHVRQLFARYVPPAVADALAASDHPPSLVGERRELSLLFADLAGFTAASERMAPEALGKALNEFFSHVTEVIHRHGGTLDKFIGDAVMAFWNAPQEDAGHALHAIECAIALQAEMDVLRAQWSGTPLAAMTLRIGVHTGEASVGNFGSAGRFTYTALGDAVNTASRLEGANKALGTATLISRVAVERAGSRVALPLAWIDRVQLSGRSVALDVFTPVVDAELASACNAVLCNLEAGRLEEARNAVGVWRTRAGGALPALREQADRLLTRIAGLAAPAAAAGDGRVDAGGPQFDFSRRISK